MYQENLTQDIATRLGVRVRTVGHHSGVKATIRASPAIQNHAPLPPPSGLPIVDLEPEDIEHDRLQEAREAEEREEGSGR
jgi:hypothetical protein